MVRPRIPHAYPCKGKLGCLEGQHCRSCSLGSMNMWT
jgi:hypothetical protein